MSNKTNTIFANIGDDSDDENRAQVQSRMTKTAAKKESRKVGAPAAKAQETDTFFAATQKASSLATGEAFSETKQGRQPRAATRGGADARGGRGDRGGYGGRGRGGEGRGRGGAGGRPRTAYKTDAEGNQVVDPARKERKPFAGKAREEGHPYDRRDGTGKARRGDKKDGHGKGNWGKDGVYKKKDEETTEKTEKAEEVVEEKKEPEPEYREEILGYSLDDFLGGKQSKGKKESRAGEKLTQKVEAKAEEKTKQETKLQNQYLKGAMAKTTGALAENLGFQADDDEVRGDRRGPRGGADAGAQRGGRKQNAKFALKKTEEDFPTL